LNTGHAPLIAGMALFFLALPPASAEVYKWVDKRGTVHYTDDPDQLPEPQRSKVLNELEEKLRKERERREMLRKRGIHVPDERLPPAPPPDPPRKRLHPATDRLNKRQADKKKWKSIGEQARERVASLENKCAELQAERDRTNQERLTMSRPGALQRYHKSLAAWEQCQDDLEKARNYLEVQLPEEARKNGIPPEWIR
jgi:hypothetical protein